MDNIMKDERFKHIKSDLRFRSMGRQERKVKIDDRFKNMFTDEKFKVKYSVDKRGRPQNYTSSENLKKYYDMSSSEDDDEEKVEDDVDERKDDSEDNEELDGTDEIDECKDDSEDSEELKGNDESESDEDEEVIRENDKNEGKNIVEEKAKFDYARGEGNVESSSEDESEYEDEENEFVHLWGELANAKTTEKSTRRLAVCSIDWDRIDAQDIYFVCKSFLPPGGIINSVKVYLSDFGRQRLELENVQGPAELVETGGCSKEDSNKKHLDEDEEGEKYHMEKLRQYQLNRLNYYYAVVECDNAETASKIYEECDGLEFESSASKLDLRYIPDDMKFDQEARQVADVTSDGSTYRPKYFTTTALQSSKVQLTWDETNPNRLDVIKRAFEKDEEENNEIQAYLASSSEDEEDNLNQVADSFENEEDKDKSGISKYRSLLQAIEQKEEEKKKKDVHLEITWGLGLKEKAEKLIQEKVKESQETTVWEQYLQKKKEKRIQKLESKKQTLKNNEDEKSGSDDENPYSDDDIPSDVDLEDPYFQEELNPQKNKRKDKKGKVKKQGKGNKDSEVTEQEKAELSLLLMDNEDSNKKHFNLRKLMDKANGKKKRKNKMQKEDKLETEDGFEMNVNDERFGALYSSHLYNIDPSDQNFKKTKGIEKVIEEKQKRRLDQDYDQLSNKKLKPDNTVKSNPKLKDKAELSNLIKSVKNKTQMFRRNVKNFS